LALSPGTRLGVYEITAQIGEGGMGEVYRATDTKLKRQVAIKILPGSLAADADRLARFQREAEVLASLNHPHIAHIYGLEDSGGVKALVMELLEGEDLTRRIANGPIPLNEVLPIARHIAEALEAAHEQGIIHRDLKPANIKVRSDGTVKVLDFGLAKALEPAGAALSSASMSPTLTTPAMTQAGMILGTAAYMSPEQARGRTVDKRSDVWAFGVVLYEMLSGRRPFAGDDITETLAAVIKDTPKYDALPPGTPRRLRRLIERCLDRDVMMRLRDIGEARVELVALETGGIVDEAAGLSRAAARSRATWVAAGAVAGAAFAAAAMFVWGRPLPTPPAATRARFQLTLPESVQINPASGGTIGVSPDGRFIVFAAGAGEKRQLWLRPIDGDDARPLAGTEGGRLPFWSPDSASFGFFAGGKLRRLEISTGTTQVICDSLLGPGGATWNRDGVIVFSPKLEGPLFRVPATGGTPTPLTALDAANHESNHMWPAFLPDGRHYLFQVFGLTNAGIYVGALDSAERTLLIRQESLDLTAVLYAPSGHLVYVRKHELVARPFDAGALRVTGDEFPLADGFGIGGPGYPAFAVSNNGVLVFRREGEQPTNQVTWFGRDGSRQGTLGPPGPYDSFDLSPDGQTLALTRATEKETSIWLLDVARGTSTRFTADSYSVRPHWSPLGDRIVFPSVRDTPPNPFVRTLAGVETRIARLPEQVNTTSWAPDGHTLIGDFANVKTSSDLWLFSASGDKAPAALLQTPFGERDGYISPNGRWLAFTSDESGANEIYVTTFPEPGRRVRVSTDGGRSSRWRDDGTELFFQTKGKVMVVRITATANAASGVTGLQVGVPRELFALPDPGSFWVPAKGGQRFLVGVQVTKAAPAPIQVVLNWSEAAKNQK
jgi:Tol biopolymer transport system component